MPEAPTPEEIERYRQNKAAGGSDGIEGLRYESRVAAWLFIQMATIVGKKNSPLARARICRQDLSFVNDLYVETRTRVRRVECKSGTSELYWGQAFRSLGWDFRQQILEDQDAGINGRYFLYLADKGNADRLAKTRPQGVRVEHFPDSNVPSEIDAVVKRFFNRLIELLPDIPRQRAMGFLKRGGTFSLLLNRTDAYTVFQAFIVAADMLKAGSHEYLDYVLQIASQRSDGMFCTHPRGLRLDVERKLAKIKNIDVVSCDGIVSYRLDNGIVGRLAVSLDQPEGAVFEDLIMQKGVVTSEDVLWAFEEMEKLIA